MASIPAKLAPNQGSDNGALGLTGIGTWVWQPIVLIALLAYLYSSVIARLVLQWWTDPNFSHGFFVPLFSAYVVWMRRRKLAEIPLSPTWSGLLLIAAGLGILIVGVFGAELFLSRSSLLLILGGMILLFGGWEHLRELFFPSETRERMPLHASTTSSDILGSWMIFPSRSTGTPNQVSSVLAMLEAINCSGKVT